MNKLAIILCSIFLITACSTTIEAIKDDSIKDRYNKPLLIIPYNLPTKRLHTNLKSDILEIASLRNQEINFELLKVNTDELSLENKELQKRLRINSIVNEQSIDIVLYFNVTSLGVLDASVSFITYQITAYDTSTYDVVWNANLHSENMGLMDVNSKKISKVLYGRLVADGVLR